MRPDVILSLPSRGFVRTQCVCAPAWLRHSCATEVHCERLTRRCRHCDGTVTRCERLRATRVLVVVVRVTSVAAGSGCDVTRHRRARRRAVLQATAHRPFKTQRFTCVLSQNTLRFLGVQLPLPLNNCCQLLGEAGRPALRAARKRHTKGLMRPEHAPDTSIRTGQVRPISWQRLGVRHGWNTRLEYGSMN